MLTVGTSVMPSNSYPGTADLYEQRREACDRSNTELAIEFGFMHLGRFSESYRQQFGELPRNPLPSGPMRPAKFWVPFRALYPERSAAFRQVLIGLTGSCART